MASVRAGANRSVSVVISRFKVESWAGAGKFVMAWVPVQFLLDGFSELPLVAGMLGFPRRGLGRWPVTRLGHVSHPVPPGGLPVEFGGVLAALGVPEVPKLVGFEPDAGFGMAFTDCPLAPRCRQSPIGWQTRPAICFRAKRGGGVNFFRGCGGPFFIRGGGCWRIPPDFHLLPPDFHRTKRNSVDCASAGDPTRAACQPRGLLQAQLHAPSPQQQLQWRRGPFRRQACALRRSQ